MESLNFVNNANSQLLRIEGEMGREGTLGAEKLNTIRETLEELSEQLNQHGGGVELKDLSDRIHRLETTLDHLENEEAMEIDESGLYLADADMDVDMDIDEGDRPNPRLDR